jgi:uncharacterized protein (TIGR02646 family)
MMPTKRCPAPAWLLEKDEKTGLARWEQHGLDWETAYKNNPKTAFTWRVGESRNNEIRDLLLKMTNFHCAYCDNYPMARRNIKPTIDHFYPKIPYFHKAYDWNNLFIACHYCQERNNNFDEKLLKPDDKEYVFEHYFVFDFTDFEIKPNPKKSKENQERAQITIDLFRLNGKPKDENINKNINENVSLERQRIYIRHKTDNEFDDLPYRFMFL